MFAAGDQASLALAQPHLGLPPDGLDGFGVVFQSQLEVPTDCGGVAVRPGAFPERATRMRVAGCGD